MKRVLLILMSVWAINAAGFSSAFGNITSVPLNFSLSGNYVIRSGETVTIPINDAADVANYSIKINGIIYQNITSITVSPSTTTLFKIEELTNNDDGQSGNFSGAALVTVIPNGVPVQDFGLLDELCVGETFNLSTMASVLPLQGVTWHGYGVNNQNEDAIFEANGDYIGIVNLYFQDISGAFGTATIEINPKPNIVISPTYHICLGNSETLNLNIPDGIYNWSGPNNFTSLERSPTIENFTSVNNGDYSLLVTDANGCTNTAVKNVVLNPIQNIFTFIGGATTITKDAPDEQYTVDGESWIQKTFTISPSNAGTIDNTGLVNWDSEFFGIATIKVNGISQCGSGQLEVTVNQALIAPATISSNAPALCVGQTITLTVSNPLDFIYTIKGPKGLVANLTIPNVTSADAGTYTIESSDIGGAIIGSESIQITVMPPMAITFTGGATNLQQNPANTTYTTNVPDATFTLSPAEAGAIDPMTGEVNWADTFVGTATITATSAMPPCGAVGARVVEITAISACIAPTFIQNSSSTATSFYPYTLGVIGNSFVFRYRKLGATDWTEMPAVLAVDEGGIGTTITGLTNNTVYEFQVKQLCATGGESDYSTTKTANTFCQTFNSYNLNATNVTTTTANIKWANNFGVPLKANIRYRKIGDVDWVTKTEVTETVVDYLTNHTLTGLDENSNYEYQIQAVCLDGSTSDFGGSKNFTTLAAPVESQNPIAMYPLNGDANDTSGNNFHGVVNGAAGFVTGVQGQALHINVGVSQYVWIPNNIQFDNIIKVSLAAWVKPQTFNLDCWSEREMIIGKGQDEVANGYGISIQRNSNSASCGEAASFDQYKFNFEYGGKSVSTPFYPVDNKWRYVTGTYDNNILKIYVNGQLVAEQTEGLLDAKNALPMWFNHATWSGGSSTAGRFGGELDNIRIYNRAISATEVMDIYMAEKPLVGLMTPATMTSNADNTLFCMGNPLIFTVNNPDNVDYIIKDFARQVVSNLTVPFAMSGNYTIESFNPITGESLGIYTHNVMTNPPMPITFTGPTTVEQNAANTTYVPSFAGASMSLIPREAGTIDGFSGVVDWNENFFGVATISAQMPPCGSGSIQVAVNQVTQTLTATAQPVILCAKSNLELKVTTTGGAGGNTYAWSGPNGYTNIVDQNPILPYVEGGPSLAGTYLVTVTDGGGATTTASVVVELSPPIIFMSGETTINQNGPHGIYVTNVPLSENVIFSVMPAQAGTIGQTPSANGVAGFIDWAEDFYGLATIKAEISSSCRTGEIQVVVNQAITSLVATTPASKTYCAKSNLELTVTPSGGTPTYIYTWSGPNGFTSNEQNPVIAYVESNPSPAGTYTILVTDGAGATATASIVVTESSLVQVVFSNTSTNINQNGPNTYHEASHTGVTVHFQLLPTEAGTLHAGPSIVGSGLVIDWAPRFLWCCNNKCYKSV